ncbi:hypothetical protein Tco_0415070 [Tanacetum coccineum]
MYLTASRPDIMFAVYACARFQVTPKVSHLLAVKRIFRYLKGQPKLGLWYPRDSPFGLEAFSNSNYVRASLDRKSTTGGCQFLGKRWMSKVPFHMVQIDKEVLCSTTSFVLKDPHFTDRRGTIDKTLFIKKDKGDILLVKQKDNGIFISQDKYVADVLKKFDFSSVKTASTPMEPNKALIKDAKSEDVDVHLYRSKIGSLMYLTASRPDIMFVVCTCARFQVTPKVSHLHAVKKIFRYLKGQPKLVIWYPRDSPFDLEAISNSDYAGASLERKSTTGGCQFLSKRLISWQCKKQTIIANSTTEAEYVAVVNCCGQTNVPITNVADEAVYEEWDDKVERATTTAASLDAAKGIVKQFCRCSLKFKTYYQKRRAIKLLEESVSILSASMLVSTIGMVQDPSPVVVKDKGKAKVEETKHEQTKTKLQERQERLGFEAAMKLQEQFDKELQDYKQRSREELTIEERSRLFVELIEKRKKYFAEKRAEERRKKPLIQAQQRTYMSNYIKHMGNHTLQQLRRYSFDELKELFEITMKNVNTFRPMKTEDRRSATVSEAEGSKRMQRRLINKILETKG